MNGFPLVILGVTLIVIAQSLWKIHGKIKEITDAVDQSFGTIETGIVNNLLDSNGPFIGMTNAVNKSFQTIEDGINNNILDSNGPFYKVTNSVDQSFQTIEGGINKTILDPQTGLLVKVNGSLKDASGLFYQAGLDIQTGKDLIQKDVVPVITDSMKILIDDVGNPLIKAAPKINSIGHDIDIEIMTPGGKARPFHDAAQVLYDIEKMANDIGNISIQAALGQGTPPVGGLNQAKSALWDGASKQLDSLSTGMDNVGKQVLELRNYVDTTVKTGVKNSVQDLEKVRVDIDKLFSSLRDGFQVSVDDLKGARVSFNNLTGSFTTGVETSVKDLKKANSYLDGLLLNVVDIRWTAALVAAGIMLIITGVTIGI